MMYQIIISTDTSFLFIFQIFDLNYTLHAIQNLMVIN
jgi:hypothetical protein